jgi:16S rRNA C1402 (ribose-2'-O) methylase RsmI
VFFEAPHRLPAALNALAEHFGPDRAAAVCRELTKTTRRCAAARSPTSPRGRPTACAARSPWSSRGCRP